MNLTPNLRVQSRYGLMTLLDRFNSKIVAEPNTGCHIWAAQVSHDGYGKLKVAGRPLFAHRVAWELQRGPIADGMEIDHICGVRCCVNPSHMELVTHIENLRRRRQYKTHCKNGHAFTKENTHIMPGKRARVCRTCQRDAKRRSQARKAAAS